MITPSHRRTTAAALRLHPDAEAWTYSTRSGLWVDCWILLLADDRFFRIVMEVNDNLHTSHAAGSGWTSRLPLAEVLAAIGIVLLERIMPEAVS